jgi:hypothetical protein
MNGLLKALVVVSLASTLIFAAGCGGDSGSGGEDPGNGLVPDYPGQIQKAKDASDKAEQKQQEIEDSLNQVGGP